MEITTIIRIIDTSKLNFNKKEIDNLISLFESTKENLNNTNKQNEVEKQEKYNGYIVEDYLSQVFGALERNKDIFGWWDFKKEQNGKMFYFDSKALLTNKKLIDFTKKNGEERPSGIINIKQGYKKIKGLGSNKYEYTSNGYCVYLQAKQVLDIKAKCDENNVNYKNYYFIINYFDKYNNNLKSIFSTKLRLDNVLSSVRAYENPPGTKGSLDPVDNFIIADLYNEGEYEIVYVN